MVAERRASEHGRLAPLIHNCITARASLGTRVLLYTHSVPDDPQQTDKGSTRSGLDQAARYSELALVLPAGCAAGWLIGGWLDSKFHTHWIFLLGLTLGFIGGMTHIIRLALKSGK